MSSDVTQPASPASPVSMPDDPIIGIDLGTTNSLVAWCDAAGPRVIPDRRGRNLCPSVVRFDEATGRVLAMGDEARAHAVEYPHQTIFSIKRLMGRSREDVQDELRYLPYEVVEGPQHTARVRIGAKVISPPEISALILQELKRRAEAYFDKPVRRAVITVPAYFDDAQRQATRDAGRLAGLDVLRLVNEPTAASLAYNLGLAHGTIAGAHLDALKCNQCPSETQAACGRQPGDTRLPIAAGKPAGAHDATVAVFDLGGGTFDFSILRLQATDTGSIDQVLGTAGDTHLGGDDLDRLIVELIQQDIRRQFGADIDFPPATRQGFRNLAEAAKIRLSDESQAVIEVSLGNHRTYRRTLTRAELERLAEPWLQRAMDCCAQALRSAGLEPGDIERVVLVGGSTRMPLVRRRVAEFFRSEPYTALNPDEVVALGAAVQGSILAGVNREMLLLDVIPLALGIETLGGAAAKLITANTTIPAKATEMFTTYVDGQTSVKIHVVQGERELVRDCRSLGQFELKGIPPMPAGLPKIEVTFLVDANGILNVTAVEQRSGKAATIQVAPNHGLTRAEVDRIERESFAHARADMTAHRLIDLRNQARLDIRNIERQLARVADEIAPAYHAQVTAKVAVVRQMSDDPRVDPDQLHHALDDMDKATVRLAEIAIKKTLAEEGLLKS